MLEHGYEHLSWSDVVARAHQGIVDADAVLAFLRARAVAEERYARSLKEAEEASVGSVLGSLMGTKTAGVTRDTFTLFEALEASKQNVAKVRCCRCCV
jgi:hypothetical protein